MAIERSQAVSTSLLTAQITVQSDGRTWTQVHCGPNCPNFVSHLRLTRILRRHFQLSWPTVDAVQTFFARNTRMADLNAVLEQLKEERAKLDRAIAALSGVATAKTRTGRRGRRTLSAAARKRIADAQRARWAKFKAKKAA